VCCNLIRACPIHNTCANYTHHHTREKSKTYDAFVRASEPIFRLPELQKCILNSSSCSSVYFSRHTNFRISKKDSMAKVVYQTYKLLPLLFEEGFSFLVVICCFSVKNVKKSRKPFIFLLHFLLYNVVLVYFFKQINTKR
jgi:sensor histidine kinase YesM